jgi:hypothetical protein
MYRNLMVFVFLSLSGCILYLEPTDGSGDTSRDTSHYDSGGSDTWESSDVWIDSAYVDCEYDSYNDISYWYFETYIDGWYDDRFALSVGVYLGGWSYVPLISRGSGLWEDTVYAPEFACYYSDVFDFVVEDQYGNYDEVRVYW